MQQSNYQSSPEQEARFQQTKREVDRIFSNPEELDQYYYAWIRSRRQYKLTWSFYKFVYNYIYMLYKSVDQQQTAPPETAPDGAQAPAAAPVQAAPQAPPASAYYAAPPQLPRIPAGIPAVENDAMF